MPANSSSQPRVGHLHSLANKQKNTYAKLKTALLEQLSSDIDEDRLCTHDEVA